MKKDMRSVLVTGCAGFIGSNMVARLKDAFPDIHIVGIDDFSTGRREALDSSISFYEGSVADEQLLKRVFSRHKPEFVFHFAALPQVSYSVNFPKKTTDVNILGTVALLDASRTRGVKRFIFSSSSAVYGDVKKLPVRESAHIPVPKSPYAVQKYACEHLCRVFSELFGMDTISLRYFNAYGPGQYGDSPYSTVIAGWLQFLYAPTKKQKLYMEGDGKQTRDFCFVDDIVSANILAMLSKKDFGGAVCNIASGTRVSVNDIRKVIEKKTGKTLAPERRPARAGDIRHTQGDISLAKKMLGYAPRVSFDEGIAKTVAWFEKRAEYPSKKTLIRKSKREAVA